jgi:hypothetical protein
VFGGDKESPNVACRRVYGSDYYCDGTNLPECDAADNWGGFLNGGRCGSSSCDGGYAGVKVFVSCCQGFGGPPVVETPSSGSSVVTPVSTQRGGGVDTSRSLKVQVLTQSGGYPIASASVSVEKEGGGVVGVGTTDASGIAVTTASLNAGETYMVAAVNSGTAGGSKSKRVVVPAGVGELVETVYIDV